MSNELSIFAKRLKQARVLRKLSMEQLCELMGGQVSKQAISKYESALMKPNSTVLIALATALDQTPDYFFRPFTYDADKLQVSFRKKSSAGAKDVSALKVQIQDDIERYLEIGDILGIEANVSLRDPEKVIATAEDMCLEAQKLRNEWGLALNPIGNVQDLLESHGVKVILTEASEEFDGVSGVVDGKHLIIVLNKKQPHIERRRFTALHELAHLLFDGNFPEDMSQHDKEKLCDTFANEMLIPSEVLREQFHPKDKFTTQELIPLQCTYGISINAILVKLHQIGILGEKRYRAYCMRRQQDKKLKAYVEESRYKENITDRFEAMVYSAIAKDLISISKAATLLNCSVNTIRTKLNLI